jgi:integrase
MAKGSIEKRGENSYRLIVSAGIDGTGKQIKKTKTVHCTAQQVDKELALFISDLERGNHATSGKMTLAQLFDYWEKNHALKNHEQTTIKYNRFMFARIREVLGNKRIDKLEPKHLLAFYQNLAEPGIKKTQQAKDSKEPLAPAMLSANTIRKHHTLISSLLAKAVQWQLIPYNVAERVEPPKQERPIKSVYDTEQTITFLQALEAEPLKYRLMTMLALTAGLRREEIFGLEWSDISDSNLHIHRASVYIPGSVITKGTKNKSSTRTVSIPADVTTMIKCYKAEENERRLKCGDKWKKSKRLFTTWDGDNAHPHSMNTWLRKFIAKHHLPPISPHSFRHMAASLLVLKGTDIRTISGKLGHSRTSTTLDIYSHLMQSAEQGTADIMQTMLDSAKTTLPQKAKKGQATK